MNLIKETNKLISKKSEVSLLTETEAYKEIHSGIQTLLNNQEINQKDMRIGFVWLATQNYKLFKLNRELSDELKGIKKEYDLLKKEREDKKILKEARANRKRLPKRDPMTRDIYKTLIGYVVGPNYTSVRLRVAFCLLAVTGVRINELLPLKVHQLRTLRTEHWIGINRSKRGPANHKAFLTSEGKRIVLERKKDFDFLLLMKSENSYIFTSETNSYRPLARETLTRDLNKTMRAVSENIENKPNITSHSFRVGYISQLWKDTKDIEFVRQSIGHQKIDSTSSYVKNLTDQERQERTLLV